ncbi:hypothetical protein HPB51_000848 [Rhipicephalus microplus]|uniref:THAP-type domain-containing protein n=1 Tax=Rhipicephalus microplus TaxID=6941 RepID=A0A9J6D7P6_RHIMP|nr:hypothetical protein HPB51_000848 [Rhipicephalus microplus]
MSYCCVPLCKSDEKKKTPGLSFHEIPSAADEREKWQAVIRRDNWSPNSTSCYTKVCSRHFRAEDFVEGKRRRFLKKGVVPSVFEDYPVHLQPKSSAERSRASIVKRACVPLKQKSDHATSAAASVVLPPAVPTPQNHELEEPEPMDITDALSDTNQRSNFPPETLPACDRGVKVDSRQAVASLLATEKAKWKRKERDFRNQVSRQQRTVDKYKLELEKLQQDSMVADISYIKERAVEQQPAALFLLDQIINFRMKRLTWSEETTRRCVVLRHLSTKAYEHMRGPTITCMRNFYRWFVLHDMSSTMQHLVQNFADARHYDDIQDSRLEWHEVTFPMYLDGLKKRCNHPQEFLTKETYEAVLVTSYSTVACTRYLLTEENFFFVLTRRFNSDPIESLFGTLRMSSGTNDMLDVRAALSGLEKILKSGIAAANVTSNVAHTESATSAPLPDSASSSQPVCTSSALVSSSANTDVQTPPSLKKAVVVLQRLTTSVLPQYLPSLQISATVYVGGHIARV